MAEDLVRYAVRLSAATRPGREGVPGFVNEWISWGAGLRAAQSVVLGAKARALFHGHVHVGIEDVQALVLPAFRHRVLINYRAEAEGVNVEKVIERIMKEVPAPLVTKRAG
jgi:MoxR-like ATPase